MLTIKAYAKINLYLDVISRYPDGYHQIESVMQSISLYDLIEISPAQNVHVTCTIEELSGSDNLAYRVAALLKARYGAEGGASIHIDKRIPVAAGLAGGSADAAATLIGLNTLWDLNLSQTTLRELGAELGADIPFCMTGGTMLCEGKGEILTALRPMPNCAIALTTPPLAVSTAEVYRTFDELGLSPLRRATRMLDALNAVDIYRLAGALDNILENVAFKRYPEILEVKKQAIESGSLGALMSGSGPSVFALYQDEMTASSLVAAIKEKSAANFATVVRPVPSGVEVL